MEGFQDSAQGLWTYHSNEVDGETTLAKLFLKLRVGELWACLGENLDSLFEVCDISTITGCLKISPSFGRDFVSDVRQVDCAVLLALKSIMALAEAVLASALWAFNSLMTLFFTDTTWTRSFGRLGALERVSR